MTGAGPVFQHRGWPRSEPAFVIRRLPLSALRVLRERRAGSGSESLKPALTTRHPRCVFQHPAKAHSLEPKAYFTFHSWRPAENVGCITTSMRSAVVVTGLNVTAFQVSFAVPSASAVSTGFHWSPSL